jgi:hypothetical protein
VKKKSSAKYYISLDLGVSFYILFSSKILDFEIALCLPVSSLPIYEPNIDFQECLSNLVLLNLSISSEGNEKVNSAIFVFQLTLILQMQPMQGKHMLQRESQFRRFDPVTVIT